jgi:hypothetical protein
MTSVPTCFANKMLAKLSFAGSFHVVVDSNASGSKLFLREENLASRPQLDTE